ncbi:hypothetical protein KMI_08g13190 [Encephalitozoon hellem]|uniref:Uncharacterized protein n=1 Tax=Encephalitozoon hellem TaxID=27973 RepID=A0A9Q9F9W1_ENCHE|nr:uncharacterized protein EHEL_070950 [Encephalitozoon hellem ATCC 50504]AFM98621.1 hypothetical protein EHEL_070950 [Encephalitozoon hellem ATCC 50504]KAG5859182.1 hypothetical protein KMI_08g13190 [Encephalitozoon hellem]UTX43567.1 hypothetical protein GPU96_07g13280 [Encephalitozoon hellem]WEL39042.1 hypothetical protein PFJ87_07g01200 [Encephalitozoon hellem]|eukprot:XP_003887602.1 hypothetical protein EHEL_070950 [Encephalitozoon hellem ATCC 50504]
MGKARSTYDLEITKILAKTMQSSYRKKQVEELVSRILEKMQSIIGPARAHGEIETLRAEFEALKQEAYSLMKP